MTAKADMLEIKNTGHDKVPPPSDSKKSKGKGLLAYFFLPGVVPQIKELGRGGFGYLAFLIAIVYQAVRILPVNHPYTKTENIGKFGIRKVIAAAANNIKLDRKNIDQIIIFIAVIVALILIVLQFASIIFVMFSGEAWAADVADPASYGGLFSTKDPDKDIAFHLMREVFGLPKMFGEIKGGQTAFHKALQTMFQFYNLAILVVAILVFIYYVIVVVAETAQTGVPFGQRFSHVYAPLRLVAAIGLLVPLNYGFNGSQYITFFAAKMGSGFATSGWTEFNKKLDTTNPLGAKNATLIAGTNPPDIEGLVAFMAVVQTCKAAYNYMEDKEIELFVKTGETVTNGGVAGAMTIAEGVKKITIIFGEDMGDKEPKPYCGSVNMTVNVPMKKSDTNGDPGKLQKEYIKFVDKLFEDSDLFDMADIFASLHSTEDSNTCSSDVSCKPPASDKEVILTNAKKHLNDLVKEHYKAARSGEVDFKIRKETIERGWGGAGIWYNKIAQINGGYVTATMSIPSGNKFPFTMEKIKEQKKNADGAFSGCKAFEPNLADNIGTQNGNGEKEKYYAATLNDVYQYWYCGKKRTANYFLDAMSAIFGLNGLMNIREKAKAQDEDGNEIEVDIHPLAKLSALGKGLVEAAIRNLGLAMGTSFLGGMLGILSPHFGSGLQAATSMFTSIATIGLSIGFLTYYILPFLPFMYMFFAVGGWVKSIFEAMVGAPLWALAHLRIDGDGFSGKMAVNGYFLILEIFLRPILTVFGFLGGMAIFGALASILNDVFDLVVENVGQGDQKSTHTTEFSRHMVDHFFFTVVYAVLLYMMAISSFKMINLVPNHILRWLGQNVASFSDSTQDPTQGLTQYAAIGGAKVGGQISTGLTQASGAAGQAGAGIFGLAGVGK